MTTETELTDAEISKTLVDAGILSATQDVTAYDIAIARAIEQAVLQSPEVQALKHDLAEYIRIAAEQATEIQALRKDAGRYRWLRDGGNDDIGVVRGFDSIDCGSTSVASIYEEVLDGEHLDDAIDAAMETQT